MRTKASKPRADQRRIEQSRREGRFPTSREAVGAFQFLTFSALLSWFGAAYCWHVIATARYLFQAAFASQLSANEVTRLMGLVLRRDFLPLGIAGGVLMLASLSAQLGVTRGGVSVKSLTPNFKRLNPLSKLRELPRQNIPSLLQAVVLLPLFASAGLWYRPGQLEHAVEKCRCRRRKRARARWPSLRAVSAVVRRHSCS